MMKKADIRKAQIKKWNEEHVREEVELNLHYGPQALLEQLTELMQRDGYNPNIDEKYAYSDYGCAGHVFTYYRDLTDVEMAKLEQTRKQQRAKKREEKNAKEAAEKQELERLLKKYGEPS